MLAISTLGRLPLRTGLARRQSCYPTLRLFASPSLSLPFTSTSIRSYNLHSIPPTSTAMAATAQIAVPGTTTTLTVHTGLFINNQFVPSVDSKDTIEYICARTSISHPCLTNYNSTRCINPATEEPICSVVAGGYSIDSEITSPNFYCLIRFLPIASLLNSSVPQHSVLHVRSVRDL